jgi:CBS domain-containing protein
MTERTGAGALVVSELLADTVARIRPDATLLEVADALDAGDVGALVVGDGDKPAGVVSERDLVSAMASRRSLDATTAMAIASKELVWCDVTATVAEVAEEMCQRYVRHVLVEEDGRLVGIVSSRDLLGAYAAADVELEP